MNVRIKAIHFEIADRLVNFINKKTERIGRRNPEIDTFDVNLNLIKPETALNKEVTIRVAIPQNGEIVASKTADTFEEAFDLSLIRTPMQHEGSRMIALTIINKYVRRQTLTHHET